jgi:hypothetical protein
MIFDRTQNDVDTAILIRRNKVQKFQALTDEEIETIEKGTITINTLNRIEEKQQVLKGLFEEMGYWGSSISNKSWNATDIFDIDDFQRLLENTNSLRKAFFVYKDTPNTPLPNFHFTNINSLEKILFDLDVMINDVKSNYRICGTFECGG